MYTLLIFLLAGVAEIGGGYMIWLWLREDKGPLWAVLGGIALIMYGIIATWQTFPTFGRVYAAYGGIFIILSLFWGWVVDKNKPDPYDWIGAAFCIVGIAIMIWAPRS